MKGFLRRRGGFFQLLATTWIVGMLLVVFACATVPVTGRKGLHMVPDSELLSLSLQQYNDVLKKSNLCTDVEKVQMVRKVGARIAETSEDLMRGSGMGSEVKNYQWEFNLIQDDKTVNAWCMPGGKVGVYTGILPIARDETGLAVVMGHEVAHAIAKHGNERMSQGLLAQMGGVALSVALSGNPGLTSELFMAAYGVGSQVGVLLPYSRLQESEADRIGLSLMARAGYDPREAVPFWKRMNEKREGRTPEFLSTHPVAETRIKKIQSYVPEALKHYKAQ